MKKIEINIGLFLILSILIHIGLFIFIASKKESASLKQRKVEAVMIELATLSLDNKAMERSEQQPQTQTVDQQERPIQQTPVERTDRTQPKPTKQRALTPTPTPIPKKQTTTQSKQEDLSEINEAQKQQSAIEPSNLKTSSSRNKPQDRMRSKTNNQKPSAGQQRSKQTTINPKEATNQIKPRRIVQCLSCPKPRYPKSALRRGIEGEPRILITINSDGRVQGVQLERSSGNPEIDRAALNAGRRSRFQAVAGGARVPVSYSVVIRGSEKHQQAVQRKEKQGYTLPTDTDNQNQPATTNAD